MGSKIGRILIVIIILVFFSIVFRELIEMYMVPKSNYQNIILKQENANFENEASYEVNDIIKEKEIIKDEIVENIEQENEIIEDTNIKINVIGDIMCHNSQYFDAYDSSTKEYDFTYAFDDIKEATADADLFIGNIETTFAGKERGYSNYPKFNSPEHLAYDLKELGIDILTTANNHCMDTEYSGLESTLNYLDDAGISHTGTNRSIEEQNTVLVKEINGFKIAFLSFTYGTNGITIPNDKSYAVNLIDEDFILSQIKLAEEQSVDLICVSMHWGIEYQTVQNEQQERLADFLIKNGVGIILGSHPHVLQPMEIREVTLDNGEIKKGFVIYSLGNFMSGQTQKGTRTSIILNLDIRKSGKNSEIFIDNISFIPIYTYKGTGNKKYKIINIERAIEKYERGEDKSIGENNYNLLKSEFNRVTELLK